MTTERMTVRGSLLSFGLAVAAAAVLAAGPGAPVVRAQEHPEHPMNKEKAKSEVTLEDVAKKIESYVKADEKGGTFKIEDKQAKKTLTLTLSRVHRERLSQVGPDLFFACADFDGADGTAYDLDFFVEGKSADALQVLPGRTSIHKENGKERYIWAYDEAKGLWVQHPAGS
jgi:hypothetical protein